MSDPLHDDTPATAPSCAMHDIAIRELVKDCERWERLAGKLARALQLALGRVEVVVPQLLYEYVNRQGLFDEYRAAQRLLDEAREMGVEVPE